MVVKALLDTVLLLEPVFQEGRGFVPITAPSFVPKQSVAHSRSSIKISFTVCHICFYTHSLPYTQICRVRLGSQDKLCGDEH